MKSDSFFFFFSFEEKYIMAEFMQFNKVFLASEEYVPFKSMVFVLITKS